MAQTEQESSSEVLERGHIYFLYRPRVERHEPEKQSDIQNFYVVLSPQGKKVYRSIVIGRERLPDPSKAGRARMWGFVDAVTGDARRMAEAFTEETYETKTRGERHRPAARPAGEGVYEIVRHDGHTHLAYALELPKTPGEVQQDLHIAEEASYLISIKNPDKPAPPGAGLPEGARPDFPKGLRERFRDRKFGEVDPPDFLDYEGTEILLIAAAEDAEEELEIRLDPQQEDEKSADVFRDLRLHKTEHPVQPLFRGRWA